MQTTKTVDLGDGVSFTIGELTFEQVEAGMGDKIDTPESARQHAWNYVLMALRNAGQPADKQTVVAALSANKPAFKAHMAFNKLHEEVMELSGFEIKKPGEPAAASASASA